MASVLKVDTIKSLTGNEAITISESGVPLLQVPVFEAYLGTNVTLTSNAFNVYPINVVSYDTNSWYNTSTYRYTPQIAGYYSFTFAYTHSGSTNTSAQIAAIYKNGSLSNYLFFNRYSAVTGNLTAGGSALIYMNGTTDYVQPYYYSLGVGTITGQASVALSYFQGHLVRGA